MKIFSCPQRLTVPIISSRTTSSGLAYLSLFVIAARVVDAVENSVFVLSGRSVRPSNKQAAVSADDGGGRCGLHLAAVGQEENTERMSQLIVQYSEREKVLVEVFCDENFIVYVVAI